MAKQGMKRPERTHVKPRNEVTPVPEIQGKAKHGKIPAGQAPEAVSKARPSGEKPISRAYRADVTDLGRDNLENDIPAADLQDL